MKKSQVMGAVYGWVSTLVLLIISNSILTVTIQYQLVTHDNIFFISFILGLIILFISGVIAGIKGKENGWLLGGLVGIVFLAMTMFIQYVGLEEQITLKQTLFLICYVLSAIIGSVLGVNITSKQHN